MAWPQIYLLYSRVQPFLAIKSTLEAYLRSLAELCWIRVLARPWELSNSVLCPVVFEIYCLIPRWVMPWQHEIFLTISVLVPFNFIWKREWTWSDFTHLPVSVPVTNELSASSLTKISQSILDFLETWTARHD